MTSPAARVAELHGPAALVEAADLLLCSSDLDLVVVRGLVPRRAARRLGPDHPEPHRVLVEAVAGWEELTALVTDWWVHHGYRDYRVVLPLLAAGNFRQGHLAAHLDPEEDDGSLYGPLTMSVVTSRVGGRFCAERSGADLFTAGREYDRGAFAALQASPDHPGRTERALRTSIDQGLGDAVLITNHPFPTYHGVDAPDRREAQIFECLLSPVA